MGPNRDGGGPAPDVDDAVALRKEQHLSVTAAGDVESRTGPGWADVHLAHQALPQADLEAVDLRAEFLGARLRLPLMIAAMTGGHPRAEAVNAVLGAAAQRHGLAMGLGSQRAGLRSPRLVRTYVSAREAAPDAFLVANLGAPQLVRQPREAALGAEQIREAVRMVRADALAVHFNFLEECVQPEGDRMAAGLREALRAAIAAAGVPAIAKETGAGLTAEAAVELHHLGFAALDVGGVGGTSFAAVEGERARASGDRRGARLGAVYRDWGVPTAVSVVGAARAGLPVVATGGVRSGLDAAKAIALGATLVGVARPLLSAALEGEAAVDEWISQFAEELRVAVFLTGGRCLADLRSAPRVILGQTREWLQDLGY